MAVGKRSLKTDKASQTGATNLTTGNTIFRDSSSGYFFVVKQTGDAKTSPKTVNKKKAELAEAAVLSYLNESKK